MALRKLFCIFPLDPTKVRMGDGLAVVSFPKDRTETYFYSLEEAKNHAVDLATKSPKVPMIIMESVGVIETKKPEVIEKIFKENGELVPK